MQNLRLTKFKFRMSGITEIKNCYVCESKEFVLHKKVNDFLVYRCKKCKLLWIEDKEFIGDRPKLFYNRTYFNNVSELGYENYLGSEEIHRKNARNILRAVDKIKPLTKSRILDIGCAFGFLLDEARNIKGSDTYGVEISCYAYEYAKLKLGLDNIYNCDLELCNFKSDFFDIIFLIDTIEHLISPKETLNTIYKILNKKGLLIVTTVDTSSLIPLFFIKPPEHLFYFNHGNIAFLLNKLGYRVILKRPYFVNYYIHDLLYRLGKFFRLSFFGHISKIVMKKLPYTSLTIPTNEMIVIAEKTEKL